jgi:hypothetical protein
MLNEILFNLSNFDYINAILNLFVVYGGVTSFHAIMHFFENNTFRSVYTLEKTFGDPEMYVIYEHLAFWVKKIVVQKYYHESVAIQEFEVLKNHKRNKQKQPKNLVIETFNPAKE